MAVLQERIGLQNEMLDDGLFGALAHDIVTKEIDVNFQPAMLVTDAIELQDYKADILGSFPGTTPELMEDTIVAAIARYKSCRRQGRDYWGRATNPAYLW